MVRARERFTRPYCMVCKHYVRNQAQHAQTLEHRNKLNPHAHVTKAEARRRARRQKPVRTQADDYVHVDKHRRSPPNDGTRRTVRVREYFRRLPPFDWSRWRPDRKAMAAAVRRFL